MPLIKEHYAQSITATGKIKVEKMILDVDIKEIE